MERTILEALGYYLIRLVMFGATAAAGIAVGIKLRKNKKAKEYISTNIIANMLGLGWAATPSGLKAMEELQKNRLRFLNISSLRF